MESLNTVAKIYLDVIKKWKNLATTQSGVGLAYRKNQSLTGPFKLSNKPHSIGEGLTQCGYCLSTSQNFLYYPIFQILLNSRGASAKLISIDIKEQFFGKCYSGSQNKWHTAILVQDGEHLFVVDLTCAQFSSAYVDHPIWDFATWQKTFRSPNCKHHLSDFDNRLLSYFPVEHERKPEINEPVFVDWLQDVTTITDGERAVLADFFLNRVNVLNRKLLLSNVNNFDFAYINHINKLLKCFSFTSVDSPKYNVMQFSNKEAQKQYISKIIKDQSDGTWTMKQYMLFSDSLKESADYHNFLLDKLNSKKNYDNYYIVFKLNKGVGIDLSVIPKLSVGLLYGIKLYTDFDTQMYNSSQKGNSEFSGLVKSNTVYLECEVNIGG